MDPILSHPRPLLRRDDRWTLVSYAEHRRLQTLDEDPTRPVAGRPKRPLALTEVGGMGLVE